jgi:hypothetical protein
VIVAREESTAEDRRKQPQQPGEDEQPNQRPVYWTLAGRSPVCSTCWYMRT